MGVGGGGSGGGGNGDCELTTKMVVINFCTNDGAMYSP